MKSSVAVWTIVFECTEELPITVKEAIRFLGVTANTVRKKTKVVELDGTPRHLRRDTPRGKASHQADQTDALWPHTP